MPAKTLRLLRATFEDFQLAADGLSRKVPPLLHRDSARWHPDGYGCNRMKPKKGQAPPAKKRKEKKVKNRQKRTKLNVKAPPTIGEMAETRLFVDMLNL